MNLHRFRALRLRGRIAEKSIMPTSVPRRPSTAPLRIELDESVDAASVYLAERIVAGGAGSTGDR